VNRVDRRAFLVASVATAFAAACGGGDSEDQSIESDAIDERSGRVEFLVPAFPDGFRAPSVMTAGVRQRVPFVVRDDLDVLRDGAPESIDISVTLDGEVVSEGPVVARREGIITPYYALEFTPPRVGTYVASTEGAAPVEFLVVEASEVGIVQLGDPMRPVETPTVEDALGVDPVCTRAVPCPFHEVSLADALESGLPTVLLVATPGFCQTDICGPVVDLLIDEVEDRDDLAVVHAEVYVDPVADFASGEFPATTPVVETYSLPYEPQLVVADAAGTIVARLDTIWDRSELRDAMAAVL
jgi:hypothetical protein